MTANCRSRLNHPGNKNPYRQTCLGYGLIEATVVHIPASSTDQQFLVQKPRNPFVMCLTLSFIADRLHQRFDWKIGFAKGFFIEERKRR